MDEVLLNRLKRQVISDLADFLPKGCFKLEQNLSVNKKELSWSEKWEIMAAHFGNKLCYESDCNITNLKPRQYSAAEVLYAIGNLTDPGTTEAQSKKTLHAAIQEYLEYLEEQEKKPFTSFLKNNPQKKSSEQNGEIKLWLKPNPNDPDPKQPWYTPARYFARQLVENEPKLLEKRDVLAQRVGQLLTQTGIKKRGGKLPLDPGTIKKALSNISLG